MCNTGDLYPSSNTLCLSINQTTGIGLMSLEINKLDVPFKMLWKKIKANIHMPRSVQSPKLCFLVFLRTLWPLLSNNSLLCVSCKVKHLLLAWRNQSNSPLVGGLMSSPFFLFFLLTPSLVLSYTIFFFPTPYCAWGLSYVPLWLSSLKLWSDSSPLFAGPQCLAASLFFKGDARGGNCARLQPRCDAESDWCCADNGGSSEMYWF